MQPGSSMNQNSRNFTCLNCEGTWVGSSRDGLEIGPGGELVLRRVPSLENALPAGMEELLVPDGPAGIAVDASGSIYFSDPQANRVLKIDGCNKSVAPVPCLGELEIPRGLLVDEKRESLLIAESGSGRVRAVRLASGQPLEIWSGLVTPWALASDENRNLYVVDHGSGTVQKFNAGRELEPDFAASVTAAGITHPCGIAADSGRIFVADEDSHSVIVVDATGKAVAQFGADQLAQPMGMATDGMLLFIGDNSKRRVLVFDIESYKYVGEAAGYQGPVAAMALDRSGGLLVHTGSGITPIRLVLGTGFARQGTFWTSAIKAPPNAPSGKGVWHRLQAILGNTAEEVPSDVRLQFFIHRSNDAADAPDDPVIDSAANNPFSDARWRPQAIDAADIFIGGGATTYIWIGAWFSGSGTNSPVIEQIRIEYDHEAYLAYLPAIYQKPGPCRDFLLRFLSLFESFNSETGQAIRMLPSLFDPRSAPADYLPWLAAWLALPLDERWDAATARRAIAHAFARYAQRGTAAGLRKALKQDASVDAIVQEPILNAAWWCLPVPKRAACGESNSGETVWDEVENSVLGYTTMLAPAHPQGAVVGTSAVLDQSNLIDAADFGSPLFGDVAFQFCVQVYRGQWSCDSTKERIREVIENEKPAHTSYHLCVLEPRMRVGFQARVGIDTIVAGPPSSMRLGAMPALGVDTALGGQQAGRIGAQLRLGVTTLLG